MRIDGLLYPCDDGVVRPVFRGEIQAADGAWWATLFLADSGADRTVFCADDLTRLGFPPTQTRHDLGGVGGVAEAARLTTQVRLACDDGGEATFRGEFPAFTDPEALDMSVLGRDILKLFTLIMAYPDSILCLIGPGHRCTIQSTAE